MLYRPPGSRWYGLGLYPYVERPLLNVRLGGPSDISRYQTLTGGVGYMVRTDFRVLGELTWDIEEEGTRWAFGLASAF